MDDVTCYPLFTLVLLPKPKKTLRPSFIVILLLSLSLSLASCRQKNTDFDKLSTNELVKHLAQFAGVPVPKADVKIMGKCNITGCSLVYSGTEQAFKEVGLSWGTGANLMCMKENYLKKKS